MEILSIDNFKCFRHFDIKLNRLTVLTGANGSGKSSIVQSVLLLKNIMDTSGGKPGNYVIQLTGYHSLSLGTFDDICSFNADVIGLNLDGNVNVILSLADDSGRPDEESHSAEASLEIASNTSLPGWLWASSFYYLNAERLGPRWDSDINRKVTAHAGDHGEYSGNMLLAASYTYPGVPAEKRITKNSAGNFNIQTDLWMSYICSDVAFKAEPITQEKCRVLLRQNAGMTAPPNTGFGYTYSLPIVLDGLMAPKGSLLIVENPEAHLHPRAQSNMGYFLGRMAGAGVKIIVETHSEHIVNGIRRAALSRLGLSTDDITLYFFHDGADKNKPTEITIDPQGNLSDFPVDFFDQVRQDMMEIIRLASQTGKPNDNAD